MNYEYKNEEGDLINFFIHEDSKTIIITGYRTCLKTSENEDKKTISVNPPGGPYIAKGMDINQYLIQNKPHNRKRIVETIIIDRQKLLLTYHNEFPIKPLMIPHKPLSDFDWKPC
jgi:hypothetical protein